MSALPHLHVRKVRSTAEKFQLNKCCQAITQVHGIIRLRRQAASPAASCAESERQETVDTVEKAAAATQTPRSTVPYRGVERAGGDLRQRGRVAGRRPLPGVRARLLAQKAGQKRDLGALETVGQNHAESLWRSALRKLQSRRPGSSSRSRLTPSSQQLNYQTPRLPSRLAFANAKSPRVLEPASGLVGLERIGPLAIHALTGPLSLAARCQSQNQC
jgi:hypothetical protein